MEPEPPPWERSYFRSLVPERGFCHPQAQGGPGPPWCEVWAAVGPCPTLCILSLSEGSCGGSLWGYCGDWGSVADSESLCCECQSKGPCDGNSRTLALKEVPHKRCPHRAGASSAPEVCSSNHVHPNLANTLLPNVTQQLSGQAAPLPPSPP